MCHRNNQLAIAARLPGQFGGRVEVYEIVDGEFPGYVYLRSAYVLTQRADDGPYDAVARCCDCSLATNGCSDESRHGPALVKSRFVTSFTLTAFGLRYDRSVRHADNVFCVRCLSWPTQAADWPTRRRNYGWPESKTVDGVVRNGCDVVSVAHRLCRHDEWMNTHQWRLSFSRAEITLLNSWMPVQQIVYHILRVFVKTERLTDGPSADAGIRPNQVH